MKKDRSWIAPLAFVTLGAVLGATALAMSQENLPNSAQYQALVTYLSLLLSAGAFTCAVVALVVAQQQMKDGRIQAEIAERKELIERLKIIRDISGIHNQLEARLCEILSFILQSPSYKNYNENYREVLFDTLRKIDKSSDIYGDTYKNESEFDTLHDNAFFAISWYSDQVDTGGMRRTHDDEREIAIEAISKFKLQLRETRKFQTPRREKVARRLEEIRWRGHKEP